MNRPYILTKPGLHRRTNAQRLMNPTEIVMHVEQRDSVLMILKLPTERVRQASEYWSHSR